MTAEPTLATASAGERRVSRSASWLLPTPVIPVTATIG